MIHLATLLDESGLPELADRLDKEILSKQCSYCHAILENGTWRPHHEKITRGNVSHGVCPKCEHILQEELEEMMRTSKTNDKWSGTHQCMRCHKIYNEEIDEWLDHDGKIENASHGFCPEHLEEEKEKIRRSIEKHKRIAMRPLHPETDIKDKEAYEQLRSLVDDIPPAKHVGRSDKGVPILTVPQHLMPFSPTGGLVRGTVGDHDSKWPFFEPILKSLGMENQPTVFVSEGKRSPWNVRHELHHIDEFDLPQRERPNVDVESDDPRERTILRQIRYLLDPREMYANAGVVLEFVANKGGNPPARFMPDAPDRTEIWIQKYTGVPRAIVRSVLTSLENDDARRILPNKTRIREIADLAQEDFLRAALREEPWIKKHLRMPDGSPAGKESRT